MITRFIDDGIPRRGAIKTVWQPQPVQKVLLSRLRKTVEVNNYKGDVLHKDSAYSPVPSNALNANATNIVLSSQAIALSGSFAPTIDNAGFTHLPRYDGTTIYYDGTHDSRRIVKRRADGFKEPLPSGWIDIADLPQGSVGGAAPKYYIYPFWIPGTCQIGWVPGDVGRPRFCHLAPSNDAAAAQRSRGREPLTDGPIELELAAVPAPPDTGPPPPSDPIPGTGAGTISVTITSPGEGQDARSPGFFKAFATDAVHSVTDWAIYMDSSPDPVWYLDSPAGAVTSIDAGINMPDGWHKFTIRVWNDVGDSADAIVNIQVLPNEEYQPPPPPPDPKPLPCVMLGTEIVPIGEGEWWKEEFVQNEWASVRTNSGRELVGVPTHRIYTGRAGLTEMRDVRKGDKIVTVLGEETVTDIRLFVRPGVKVCVHMSAGHLYWANGVLSHNVKVRSLD